MSNNAYVTDSDRGSFASGSSDASSFSVPIPISWGDADFVGYMLDQNRDHPVMAFVKRLPFDSPLYPANTYHGFAAGKDGQDVHGSGKQEGASAPEDGLITWCPPAHDLSRPKRKGCGFIRRKGSVGKDGVRFTACSSDVEHYVRGRRSHCWSLYCPECANDTALRFGSRVEERLLSYETLMRKKGLCPGPLGHWVVSPVQEYAKSAMQTVGGFSEMRSRVEAQLQDHGALAGVLVFHPWRQNRVKWRLSPHFHSVLYGFIDTDAFRRDNPGWVIKKIHPGEELRSISQSVAYLATHMGLGLVERDVSEVDYAERFLGYMLPGLSDDKKSDRPFRFTEEDESLMAEGKGRMVGDLSGMDWTEFAMAPLSYSTRVTYYGLASHRSLQKVAVESEYRVRACPACGGPLCVYDGICDACGTLSRYRFDNAIRAFSEDVPAVREAVASLRRDSGSPMPLSELAPRSSLIVSTDEVRPKVYPSREDR